MTRLSDVGEIDGESRRRVLQVGGTVSGLLALGFSGSAPTAAQERLPVGKALMFHDEYRPDARFRVVSPVIDGKPDVPGVENQDVWAGANTRIIEYLNTDERVSLFPISQADIERGAEYELSAHTLSVFDRREGIVSVEYTLPSGELYGNVRSMASTRDDTTEGGGTALVGTENFYPGALFRVVSDVLDWSPSGDAGEGDLFTEHDTRYGAYLNTGDEFLFYPARSADLERGGVYEMEDAFDVADPARSLVAADFDRVDESSLGR